MIIRTAAALFAFLPFGFALMRGVETDGRDLRYLWVAFAAFIGAMVRMAMAAHNPGRPMTRGALALGVFCLSMLSAVFTAWLLGSIAGPLIFLAGAGFAACFAASTFLRMPARR